MTMCRDLAFESVDSGPPLRRSIRVDGTLPYLKLLHNSRTIPRIQILVNTAVEPVYKTTFAVC